MQMIILASYKSRNKGCYLRSKDFGGHRGKTTGGNRHATQSSCYTQEKQIRLSISNC